MDRRSKSGINVDTSREGRTKKWCEANGKYSRGGEDGGDITGMVRVPVLRERQSLSL